MTLHTIWKWLPDNLSGMNVQANLKDNVSHMSFPIMSEVKSVVSSIPETDELSAEQFTAIEEALAA